MRVSDQIWSWEAGDFVSGSILVKDWIISSIERAHIAPTDQGYVAFEDGKLKRVGLFV